MSQFGLAAPKITNNTNTNIAIYIVISIVILLSIAFCIKKCYDKFYKNKKPPQNLETVGTYKADSIKFVSVSEVDADTDVDIDLLLSDRPSSSGWDPNKVAFFNTDLLKINVKTSNGEIRPFQIMNSFTISQAKQMIAKQFNIPIQKQEIRFQHKRCDSTSQIGQLNIQNGDIIEVIELSDEEIRDQIKVTLKRKEMEDIELYCSNLLTVKQFKQEVFAKTPVMPIQEQILSFGGTELMDLDATLQEYSMDGDCEVVLEWKKIDVNDGWME